MNTCPKCGLPLLPCCKKCQGEGHAETCQSEEAQ